MDPQAQRTGGTREKILTEAAGLFTRQGYAGTSTREIAAAVGISQPGLYRHFPAKADIYLALADEILQPWLMAAKHAQGLKVTSARKFLWLLGEVCGACVESPYEVAFLLTSPATADQRLTESRKTYQNILKLMQPLVREAINHGEFRSVDVRIALHMCMSLTDLLIFPSSGAAVQRIEEILALTAYGLFAERSAAGDALAWVIAEHQFAQRLP